MGRAKSRGSRELRVEMAIARNLELSRVLQIGSPAHRFKMAKGIQALANKLTAVGALPVPISKDFYATNR